MSESVDDILRELSGISFAPSEEQTYRMDPMDETNRSGTDGAGAVHTPSVTETLLAVRELIEEPDVAGIETVKDPLQPGRTENVPAEQSPVRHKKTVSRQKDPGQPSTHEKMDAHNKMSFFARKKAKKAAKASDRVFRTSGDDRNTSSSAPSDNKDRTNSTGQTVRIARTKLDDQPVQKETAVKTSPAADFRPEEKPVDKPSDQSVLQPAGQTGATGQFTPVVRVSAAELAHLGQVEEKTLEPSRRERLVLSEGRTRRFVSSFQPEREEKLQGGAALRRVTRRASSNVLTEEEQGMTLRIPAQSPSESPSAESPPDHSPNAAAASEEHVQAFGHQEMPSEDIPDETLFTSGDDTVSDGVENETQPQNYEIDLEQIREMDRLSEEDEQSSAAEDEQATRPIALDEPMPAAHSARHQAQEREKLRRQQQQQLLKRVEATENEPAPELSRSEIRKLKKQQQQEERQRQLRRMQQREQQAASASQQQEEKENIYRVREVSSSETAAGFAPAFSRLQRLNSAAEISSWRRALRDLAGTSIGMGLLIGFFAVVTLVLTSLTRVASEFVGNAVLMWSSAALGLVAGVCGFGVIAGGIRSLFRFRTSRDIMPALVYLVTMAETVLLAFHPEELAGGMAFCYLPVGLFVLSSAYMSRWMVASTALRNLRFLHTGGSKYYLHVIRDSRLATEMTRGVVDGPAFVAVNRRTESVSDFMKLSLSMDESDRLSRNFSVIGLLSGLLVMGFAMLFGWSFPGAASLMTSIVCLFSPVLTMYLFSYPCRRTARFMERAGGVIISEKAIARYSLLNGALMDASDIFPPGFVTLSGLKTFGSARVDDVMIDTASMILGSGSVLESIFEGIIGDSGLLRPVEDRQYEDGKGLVGFVDGRQVLVGNKALLESRGIRFSLDEHRKWASGVGCACVYLAVAGELAGVFLIRLQTSVRSEEAIQIFADNGIRLAIRTTDSFLTPRLLGRLFRINAELVKILPQRLGVYVDRLQGKVRVKQAVAVNDGSLSGFAGCAACARRLSFMEGLNRVMMVLSVVLGLCMLLMLTVLGSFASVTPLVMSGYALFWPALGWILQKMIRI